MINIRIYQLYRMHDNNESNQHTSISELNSKPSKIFSSKSASTMTVHNDDHGDNNYNPYDREENID